MGRFVRANWPMLLLGEGLCPAAYLLFVAMRMGNPDLWQPWFGGEKFMEFAFLNGILRSPTFPPVDPHFAGGYINYYYFGIYLVSYLIKLTGIYAEVAFNLAIPMIFGLTVVNAYARGLLRPAALVACAGVPPLAARAAVAALLAPFFVDADRQPGRLRATGAQLRTTFGLNGFSSTPAGSSEPLVLAAAWSGAIARRRAGPADLRLLGAQPGDPLHHQRISLLELSLRGPPPPSDRDALCPALSAAGADTAGRSRRRLASSACVRLLSLSAHLRCCWARWPASICGNYRPTWDSAC